MRAIAFELNHGFEFAEAITELNILNVDLEEYDVYLYLENGDILHRYNYRTNLYAERGYDWITLKDKQGNAKVDVNYEKRNLHYDLQKKALVVLGEYVMVDYSDFEEEDEQGEKSKALYLMFIKCVEERLHYVV